MNDDGLIGLLLNFRDATRSARCVRSLLDEGVPRVLVWDNSADEGVSASQLRDIFSSDPRVIIEVSANNLGFAMGVNRSIRLATERLGASTVLIINNDATLMVGALRALRGEAAARPQAAVISMDIDHAGTRGGVQFYQRLSGLLFARPVAGTFSYASGCCLWIDMRRVPLPLFDEAFFMYGEDWELGWRLRQMPGMWIHLPSLLVSHEGSASSKLGSTFYETHMVAAHLLLARRLGRSATEAVFLSATRLPVLLARAVLRSMRYRSLRPLRALGSGARLAWRRLG
ncbi:glycosyltransferase [Dyella telluris]|uniref:Glycosyltransferase 2-like domain-containing protein n=1 Tax=Dyella telluris TaxID=2763498 RepID=A0A7G8Q0R7_9GAMM|nr:glycosyltransferase [Dyella telluris]QNK00375.1 hypothetical protein H8F01_14810 [Dyella telluris]